MKQESICGEELKTEIISMVKNLKQKNISGEALKKQKSIYSEELNTEQYVWYRADTELYTWCRAETKKTRSKTPKDEFFASYLKKKNSSPLKQ